MTRTLNLAPKSYALEILPRVLRAAHRSDHRLDAANLNWPGIVSCACDAWLGGLLLEGFERHAWPLQLPQMQQLRWQASRIHRKTRQIMDGLTRVAPAFRDRHADVMVLKGAALNLTLYSRLDRRPMSDLDLLVRYEDVHRATDALESAGFHRGAELVREDFFPRFYYATEFLSESPREVRIDLHVRPFRPMAYATTAPGDAFFRDSRAIEIGGVPVRILSDEKQFVHLAAHCAIHGHSRLLWLYDLCRLVDVSGAALDWDRVVSDCRRMQLVLPVREAMRKIEGLWGTMFPAPVRRSLDGERVGVRAKLCLAQAPHDAVRPIRHVAVNLLCAHGWRYRLAYLRRVLWPDSTHMGAFYGRRHRGWIFLAHLRRCAGVLIRPLVRSVTLSRPTA